MSEAIEVRLQKRTVPRPGICECFLNVNDSCGVEDTAEILCGLEQTRCVGV